MIIGLMADKGGVCKTTAAHNMGAELALLEPVRAVAPGQSGVLYRGDRMLGGGILA